MDLFTIGTAILVAGLAGIGVGVVVTLIFAALVAGKRADEIDAERRRRR